MLLVLFPQECAFFPFFLLMLRWPPRWDRRLQKQNHAVGMQALALTSTLQVECLKLPLPIVQGGGQPNGVPVQLLGQCDAMQKNLTQLIQVHDPQPSWSES